MVNLENFATLHPEGRRLSVDFFERAGRERNDTFPAFMHLWVSFNSWMACVTGLERDADMVKAVGKDDRLNRIFTHLMNEHGEFNHSVSQFAEHWPIFNAQHVHTRLGQNFAYQFVGREEFVANVIDNPKIGRRPDPWEPDQAPQWSDLLEAIYQVRCNLFHGTKSPQNNIDREFVELAFDTLYAIIQTAEIFHQG